MIVAQFTVDFNGGYIVKNKRGLCLKYKSARTFICIEYGRIILLPESVKRKDELNCFRGNRYGIRN